MPMAMAAREEGTQKPKLQSLKRVTNGINSVSVNDFLSETYPNPAMDDEGSDDDRDNTNGHFNSASLTRSSPAILVPNTPSSAPGQPRASSPLLPYRYNPVEGNDDSREHDESKRTSAVGNTSHFDSLDMTYSSKGIKKLIGPWNLGATLGEGATGRVRKARHIITSQIAAVKIMSKRVATVMRSQSVIQMDDKIAARAQQTSNFGLPFGLEREIVIMKLIIHPNITKLYDLWENRGEM